MSLRGKSIQFETTEDGCFVPVNMKLNADGYFRKGWKDGMEMFHRFIWRARKGPIPDGFEINHLCGNRACQNVDHMECISGRDHAVKTNQERYAQDKEDAWGLWMYTQCTPTQLRARYGWCVYGWVRGWKNGAVGSETHPPTTRST